MQRTPGGGASGGRRGGRGAVTRRRRDRGAESGASAGGGRAGRGNVRREAACRCAARVAGPAARGVARRALAQPARGPGSAARIWTARASQRPTRACRTPPRSNPLSDEPNLVAGSIALRFGELARADREFARALQRTPGRRLRDARARRDRLRTRAARGARSRCSDARCALNPRDPLDRGRRCVARAGAAVDVRRTEPRDPASKLSSSPDSREYVRAKPRSSPRQGGRASLALCGISSIRRARTARAPGAADSGARRWRVQWHGRGRWLPSAEDREPKAGTHEEPSSAIIDFTLLLAATLLAAAPAAQRELAAERLRRTGPGQARRSSARRSSTRPAEAGAAALPRAGAKPVGPRGRLGIELRHGAGGSRGTAVADAGAAARRRSGEAPGHPPPGTGASVRRRACRPSEPAADASRAGPLGADLVYILLGVRGADADQRVLTRRLAGRPR